MAQPVWITESGSLGVIPEGIFYQIPLQAYDPDHPNDPEALYYEMIAGALPAGIQCTRTGLIVGIPNAISSLQGVPTEVSRNVTSKFTVRAYTEKIVLGQTVIDRLADRTFELTVTGQDNPRFVTPAGNIGTFYDGSPISVQVQTTDNDPNDATIIRLVAGSLPPGTTLSPNGLISGYIIPLIPITDPAGYSRDNIGFDEYPFDYSTRAASTNYQFTLEITDGKESDLRTFEIYVYSRDSMTADTTDFTADSTFITADESPTRVPFISNSSPSNIGTYRSDNFFAYQFIGVDLDGDPIEYIEYPNDGSTTNLPPGLTLDLRTGWLFGSIPDLGATENTYNFSIFVRKTNFPDVYSNPYNFSMTLVGQAGTDVVWLSPSNLGTIVNGTTSTFEIVAESVAGVPLQYELKENDYPTVNDGLYNKLPQGLRLLSSGHIAGNVSFNTFALDGGTTTFDSVRATRLSVKPTTFDMSFTFTVHAFSSNGLVSAFKTFTITVDRQFNEPYESLYIKAMPPLEDRNLISGLLQNQEVIPTEFLYRADDPNFGVAQNVIYNHAYGLTSSTYEKYMSSLFINHYWRNLTLGQIKTARATDRLGNTIYEVVYCNVFDDLVNSSGQSVSKQVTLPYAVNYLGNIGINTVYPNSLINMRDQVIDVVGQVSRVLPDWMLSKQEDGKVLGFTPAWVICYAKPGRGKQIAYNIVQQYGNQLNTVDFKVDRYELNRLMTKNWDPDSGWVPQPPAATTFDLVPHYRITGITAGTGYATGDTVSIAGSLLGGIDGLNDQILTVEEVNITGGIVLVSITGQAPILSVGNTYANIAGTNIVGSGNGADFDFVVASGDPTTFDANSLRFEAPVDMYSNTEEYNKYLVFPRRNILV